MKKFVQEFKEFAMRGNVMDLAVGVIIGGAFGKITTSLVDNMISPIISALTGKIQLNELAIVIPGLPGQSGIPIAYGSFLQAIIDFLITALVIFVMVKLMNRLRDQVHAKEEEAPPAAPEPSKEELLLTEIRDLLKENKEKGTNA